MAASPGAGKSRVARELLGTLAGNDGVVFHAPTLALSEEAAAHARALGGQAHVIRGRLAADPEAPDRQMYRKPGLVARGIRLGLSIRKSFCEAGEARCEHATGCAYLRQFAETGTSGHRYMATSYLGYPDPDDYDSTLRVVDETFWANQLSVVTVDIAAFRQPRTFLRHFSRRGRKDEGRIKAHAALLEAAHALVEALMAGRSPLDLEYTAEDYRSFARLEHSAEADRPALAPDQTEAEQAALLGRAEQLLRPASWNAAIWSCLADAKARGRTTTERLRLVSGPRGLALRLCRKHPPQHRQPMLLLDADADPEILAALGLDLQRASHMVLRPNAEILQVHDRRMTQGSLLDGAELREAWRRVIRREVLADRMGQGGGVLVGASRKVVRRFFEDAGHDFAGMSEEAVSQVMLDTPLFGAQWLWFGGRALGTNRYRDCSTVLVIGREELPVATLEDYGRALWGDRAEADLSFVAPGEDGRLRLPEIAVPYEMTDGSAVSVRVPCHPDSLIRRVQIQTRELATRQLVERLRLARSPTRKRVILGCNLPIPGLPVDELVSWEALRPTRPAAALVDGLLDRGGLRLSDGGLAEDAPGVFGGVEAVKGYRKRCGLAVADVLAGLPHPIRHSLRIVRLRQARPYARACAALVAATSDESALQRAEQIWGPLTHCTCLGTQDAARVPSDAVLGGHRIGPSPVPLQGVCHASN